MQPLIQFWRNEIRSGRPIWFAGLYAALSWVWIFLTDKLIGHLTLTVEAATHWSMFKGFVYVAITSGLIYAILRRLEKINKNLESLVATRTATLTTLEEQARTREEWLRRLVASLPDVSWTAAEDGRTIFISPNVESIFGYSAAELCANGAELSLGRIHPDQRPRVVAGFQALFSRGQRFDEEYQIQCRNGRWIWVHDRAIQTHMIDGVMFADGIFSDITARKEAEVARKESDKRYRLLVERNLAGVFRAQLGGKILDCNPALVRMLGYHLATELLGRTYAEILHDPAEESVLLDILSKNGSINNAEIRLRRKDGAILWGLHNVCSLPSDNGGRACIEGTVIDVTERRQSEEALQKQLALMRAINTSAPDALFMLDTEGRITFANSAGERMLGYSTAELVGKVMHDVCHGGRGNGSPLTTECTAAAVCNTGNTLRDHEDVLFRKDGTKVDVSCSSAPLLQGSQFVGSVIVVQDITRRKLVEQQYQSLQTQFLHAQKMEAIGRLAGGIAHDFNNLLQVINGYSALIVDECVSDSQLAKRAWAIHEAGSRAARLTQQLLDFSRKDASDAQTISLSRAINELMKMVRTLIGEDIELTTGIRTNGACVRINAGQLEQLIMNLVVNARDAMPKGGKLRIETSCTNLDEWSSKAFGNLSPGAYVRISVSDTGCGMDEATMNRAFEPFFTTKERGKGTGLGLSTVYGIVTQNGGGIQIDSSPDAGTTFHICLPVVESRASREEIGARLPLPQGTERVLVAEDEVDVRSLISGQLGRLGYKVLEAGNGAEALQLAKDNSQTIDLLISDVIMPQMGGQELADRIREICPTIRIVQMSGYNDAPEQPHDDERHSIHRLQKPFTLESLAAMVRQVLDQ